MLLVEIIIWITGLFIGTIFIWSIASYCACVCVRLDSENTAVTLSALLASLNSCCNPWIYMGFSGHLLQDFAHCFPCCHKIQQRFRKEDSDSSLRRTTLLTKIVNRSPTCSSGTWKEFDRSPNTSRSAPAETWRPGNVTLLIRTPVRLSQQGYNTPRSRWDETRHYCSGEVHSVWFKRLRSENGLKWVTCDHPELWNESFDEEWLSSYEDLRHLPLESTFKTIMFIKVIGTYVKHLE